VKAAAPSAQDHVVTVLYWGISANTGSEGMSLAGVIPDTDAVKHRDTCWQMTKLQPKTSGTIVPMGNSIKYSAKEEDKYIAYCCKL